MIRVKYLFSGSWESYRKPHHCSPIWRKICAHGHMVQNQFLWLVGTGQKISLLSDPWVSNIPISKWPTFLNMEANCEDMKVSDIITQSSNLDIAALTSIFGAKMMKKIYDIPVACRSWPDQLVENNSRMPKVSLADMYTFYRNYPSLDNQRPFK